MKENKIKHILLYDLNSYCGGTLVIAELCKILRSKGYDAKIILAWSPIKGLTSRLKYCLENLLFVVLQHVPKGMGHLPHIIEKHRPALHLRDAKIKIFSYFNKSTTVVIYPEVVYGNPLYAQKVIRWLLFHYKYIGDTKAYDSSDVFICFRSIFNDITLNPECLTVIINAFDEQLYKQYNFGHRSGKCYIIRKGKDREDLPDHFDGPIIDNLSEPDKVHTLNQCEFCYCYDTQTFYSCIAAICGCLPIVVPEPGKTKDDYLKEDDGPFYGVAFGEDEQSLLWAKNTRNDLLRSLDYYASNCDNADKLINIIQQKFGLCVKKSLCFRSRFRHS